MMPNTNERVDGLMQLSDRVYPIIDSVIDNEASSRRMLRVGIASTAIALREQATPAQAGDIFHSQLITALSLGGLSTQDATYDSWPQYRQTSQLLNISRPGATTTAFDTLSNKYGDVRRATKNAAYENETDASHAIHLSALALPYAAEFYPSLSQGKIAMDILIHDILEGYTDDVATLRISDAGLKAKHDNEALAFIKFEKEYGAEWPELVAVVNDYEQMVDREAAFVKSFDKIDPGFTHFANHGFQLLHYFKLRSAESFMATAEITVKRMAHYATQFPLVVEDRHTVHQRIAAHVNWPE